MPIPPLPSTIVAPYSLGVLQRAHQSMRLHATEARIGEMLGNLARNSCTAADVFEDTANQCDDFLDGDHDALLFQYQLAPHLARFGHNFSLEKGISASSILIPAILRIAASAFPAP